MQDAINKKLTEYISILKRIKAFNEALHVMYWDLRTGAPKRSVEGRSEVIGMLSQDVFQLMTSDKMGELLDTLLLPENKGNLDDVTIKSLEETKKVYDKNKKIPSSMYKEYIVLVNKAESIWEDAKMKADFKLFKPYLEKIVTYNQEFVKRWGYEGEPYNALLDQYEPGMTVDQLDTIFGALREQLVPLLEIVKEAGPVYSKFLRKQYDLQKQREFSAFILKKMGYDFTAGRLDQSLHPFQITLNRGDVRVTTRFVEDDLTMGLFSTMHEGGHAQYEQNMEEHLDEWLLGEGASMAIHESQSRFWENIMGRSPDFWEFYYKDLTNYFPDQLKDVPKMDFVKAINEMKASAIRMDADELTYSFHIMIRYEIEKDLINGNIKVEDLPEIWNQKMEEYLGIVPDNDGEGILQDVHWSNGMFGYFPTYALGNIYSAQFYHKLREDIPECNEMLRHGNLIPIKAWLTNRIHQYGKLKTPAQLIQDVTGEELNPKYFIEYLTNKVKELYEVYE